MGDDGYDERFKVVIEKIFAVETKPLNARIQRLDMRLARVSRFLAEFRAGIPAKRIAELERFRRDVRTLLRHNQNLQRITIVELFEVIDKDHNGEIDEGEF